MANEKDRAQIDFDPSYFEDDLRAFDDHINKNEGLYNELHDVFKRTTSGSMAFGATRDIAELGRTLSSVRSTGIEAVNKRFNAKRSVIELKQKAAMLKKDVENGAETAIVKALLHELRHGESYKDIPQPFGSGSTQSENRAPTSDAARAALDSRVQTELDSGSIKLTNNDKAMKYDFQKDVDGQSVGGVEYAYNESISALCAVSRSDGKMIHDYPLERIPRLKIVKITDAGAITDNGQTIKVIKG
jgi:hypothetical protein